MTRGFRLKALDMWYRQLPGALLLAAERAWLDEILPKIPGQFVLQVGGPSDFSLLQTSPIMAKYYLNTEFIPSDYHTRIQSSLEALPLQPNSVDLIIVVHLIGFANEPQLLLQEAYQSLRPGGQLIVLGFNRWSLWAYERFKQKRNGYPWQGTFYAAGKVRRWLRKIGYQVTLHKSLCFVPPLDHRPSKRAQLWLERLGKVFFPGMGAVYALVAQKQKVSGEKVVADWLQKKMPMKNGYVEPTFYKRKKY